MIDSRKIRHEFQALNETVYLNSAYMGPYPLRTQKALQGVIERWSNPSQLDYSWVQYCEQVREQLARFLKVSVHQCSLQSSSGEAISFYASGCAHRDGDRVAVFREEYPSDVLPWMFAKDARNGLELDFYDKALLFEPQQLITALHPRTRFLTVAQVGFQDGNRIDLNELGPLLRDREIRFLVDSTQALGAIEITPGELQWVDLMVCSAYKWLLAPYGQAIAYWSDRALSEVRQTHGNWLTQPQAPGALTQYSIEAKPGARKFDRGQAPNMFGLHGLAASLTLFEELGGAAIAEHNVQLASYFIQNIPRQKYALVTTSPLRSSIVCLKALKEDVLAVKARLDSKNIDLSVREGHLRASFHLFNSLEQVQLLLDLL
jgi:selenocysteine lyase/cysteine desulfurase